MKKVLAIFLSALLVCISIAPMSIAAAGPELATRVTEGNYSETAGQVASVTTTTFTVVVKAPKGIQKLVGMNLYFEFDPAVLSVAKAGLAGTVDAEGNAVPNFNGLFVSGLKSGSDNQYTMAWASNSGVSKNQSRDLVFITFNVLDTSKTQTSLNLYIDEFRTEDGNNNNDVTKTVLYENRVLNFNFPADTPPATTAPVTDAEEGETDASDINKLLQIIRDLLAGNGVTFADFADAIANMLGNAELTDIIEQLVDGDVDISELFQEILSGLGLDFGSFEDILNKIIDFIMGLINGGGDDKPTNAVASTAAGGADGSASTTAAGSSSSSEKTGDMGVALAATVCVAASAAFVLTRKKKEIL